MEGFFTSAETIGEFYGIVIFFILVGIFNSRNMSKLDYAALISSLLGLYFSNNRTAILFVSFLILTKIILRYRTKKLLVITSTFFTTIFVGFMIGVQNLLFSFDYTSSVLISRAKNYEFANSPSSAMIFLENSDSYAMNFLSYFSFILNRTDVWAIFLSRYNPSYFEFLFGSGPFNFGQLYGEILINETKGLLLPHSSFFSFLVFFGVVGLTFILFLYVKNLYKVRNDLSIFDWIFISYLSFNVLKNDVLLYLPCLILYSFLLFLIFDKNNSFRSFFNVDSIN